MAQDKRHWDIAECLAEEIKNNSTDPYLGSDVRVEDFNGNQEPTYGIIVSPYSQTEMLGTNEQDDWKYTCIVTRNKHAMGNSDGPAKAAFLTEMRLLFHRKRLQCDDSCFLYSSISPDKTAIPQAWQQNNNSVAMVAINTIVRESREID